MELKDTIEMMNSDDYKERFRAEYFQIRIRYEKLKKMVDKYAAGELSFKPACTIATLHKQEVQMFAYLRTLEFRAEIEGIDLRMEEK